MRTLMLLDYYCKECGVRLSQFEAEEKLSLCMSCYKDIHPKSATVQIPPRLKRPRNKFSIIK